MNIIKTVIFALTSIALAACVGGKPHLESIGELQPGEVVLVGKIELVPPLTNDEQNLKTATSDRFRNRVHMMVSDKKFDLDNLPMSAGNDSLFVGLSQDFYVRQDRANKLFYSGSIILMESAQRNVRGATTIDVGQMKLPGGLTYSIQPHQKAIYLGTLRYYRDDYNAIKKVKIINDYDKANRRYIKKFGKKHKLYRAKVSQTNT